MNKFTVIVLYTVALFAANSVFAQTYSDSQGVVYSSFATNPYTVQVTGYSTINSSVTIPNTVTYQGVVYNVTGISDSAFKGCLALRSIVLSSNVLSIGINAFSDCTNLSNVTLPTGLVTIKDGAFVGTAIYTITIPSTVATLGTNPFGNCTNLFLINVDSANPRFTSLNGALLYKDLSYLICYCAGSSSEVYSVPLTTTLIAPYAFFGCENLSSIYCPNGYEYSFSSISNTAFTRCDPLLTLVIQPQTPAIKSITAGDQNATISFNPLADLGRVTVAATGVDVPVSISNYYVTVATFPQDSTSNINVVNGGSSATSIQVPNLVNGVTYSFALGVTTSASADINIVGGALSSTVSAMPNSIVPVITTQPISQAVAPGAAVTLTVANLGSDSAYQWYLNGTPITGAVSANYTIPTVNANNIGSYTVSVTSSVGSVLSNPAVVSINTANLVNLSLLGTLNSSNPSFTTGFAINGIGTQTILIRADGPGLIPLGVSSVLSQIQLQLYDSAGNVIATNTGWSTPSILGNSPSGAKVIPVTPALMASAGAFSLPTGSNDCALIVTVPKGTYTAQVTGLNSSAGKVIIEVYQVPNL